MTSRLLTFPPWDPAHFGFRIASATLDGLPVDYVTCHLNSPASEGNIASVGV